MRTSTAVPVRSAIEAMVSARGGSCEKRWRFCWKGLRGRGCCAVDEESLGPRRGVEPPGAREMGACGVPADVDDEAPRGAAAVALLPLLLFLLLTAERPRMGLGPRCGGGGMKMRPDVFGASVAASATEDEATAFAGRGADGGRGTTRGSSYTASRGVFCGTAAGAAAADAEADAEAAVGVGGADDWREAGMRVGTFAAECCCAGASAATVGRERLVGVGVGVGREEGGD